MQSTTDILKLSLGWIATLFSYRKTEIKKPKRNYKPKRLSSKLRAINARKLRQIQKKDFSQLAQDDNQQFLSDKRERIRRRRQRTIKRRTKPRVHLTYGKPIRQILKQTCSDLTISPEAVQISNEIIETITEQILRQASQLANHAGRVTLTTKDLNTALTLILPSRLQKFAKCRGISAAILLEQSYADDGGEIGNASVGMADDGENANAIETVNKNRMENDAV